MSRMGAHYHDQIVSEPRVINACFLLVACRGLRSLQHDVDLGEVDVTEQRRNHAPNGRRRPGQRPAMDAVGDVAFG